jgi:hypothetical protein
MYAIDRQSIHLLGIVICPQNPFGFTGFCQINSLDSLPTVEFKLVIVVIDSLFAFQLLQL